MFVCLCACEPCPTVNAVSVPDIPTPTDSDCPKCGANKVGEVSCCFSGGTWFKQCGNPGDSKFEHTWPEGVQACGGKLTKVESCNEFDGQFA